MKYILDLMSSSHRQGTGALSIVNTKQLGEYALGQGGLGTTVLRKNNVRPSCSIHDLRKLTRDRGDEPG